MALKWTDRDACHFELCSFLGVCLGVELDHRVGHIIFLFVVLKGAPTLFSAVVVPSYIPATVEEGSLSRLTLRAFAFDDGQKFNTRGF